MAGLSIVCFTDSCTDNLNANLNDNLNDNLNLNENEDENLNDNKNLILCSQKVKGLWKSRSRGWCLSFSESSTSVWGMSQSMAISGSSQAMPPSASGW